jgi:sugar/nucleoside kinase (ribokinase family)/sugar phosphate isomerase/epimerase
MKKQQPCYCPDRQRCQRTTFSSNGWIVGVFIAEFIFGCVSYGAGHDTVQNLHPSPIVSRLVRKSRISNNKHIVVVGSVNADTFLSVLRLPVEGENLTTLCEPWTDVPGGKGCTQAVAAAKLLLLDHRGDETVEQQNESSHSCRNKVTFVGQFGNDDAAKSLLSSLESVGVDVQYSGHHNNIGSGRGYVFTSQDSGAVSAVVSGGTNILGWDKYEAMWDRYVAANRDPDILRSTDINLYAIFSKRALVDTVTQPEYVVVMLQREIPEKVNLLVATYCREILQHNDSNNKITVVLDGGGEDRPISPEMLRLCDYIMPNESELRRLVHSFITTTDDDRHSQGDSFSDVDVVNMAQILLRNGACNVLVTRGKRGSTWVSLSSDKTLDTDSIVYHHQPAYMVEKVTDETGAGDCYRAGFIVAYLLLQQQKEYDLKTMIEECMTLASSAGACAVTSRGAVPAAPSWKDILERFEKSASSHTPKPKIKNFLDIPPGDGLRGGCDKIDSRDDFSVHIGSRLNSMKDRPELWGSPLLTPKDFVQRQSKIRGLTCVDFNYPQHFHNFWSSAEAKATLDEAGLIAGAVCLRYPSNLFARGAMNHPDDKRRREAIQLTMDAAQTAIDIGCNEVVVWSAFDGYDYPFQVDYSTKWQELVDAFQECCDSFPNVKFSLEYKPTDENTRFFTVPSTGAALLMALEVNRSNFGLTLDVGHMLMSGENPGQSIAMVGRAGKLFGIQLNDGYTRLAAEDGLMFGSVHPRMALEVVYQLQKINFRGHIYFDTFPQRSDPIKEAEYNIRRVKAFWKVARTLTEKDLIDGIMKNHDAISALELVDKALGEIYSNEL